MPTKDCGCTTDQSEYFRLFPKWATDEDIALSIKDGMLRNAQ